MNTWVLVMYVFAGTFAKGDSVALQTIDGFSSRATCEAAGNTGKPIVSGTLKDYKFICVEKK